MKEESRHKLKVVLISHSDMLGGAAVVTYRLMVALRREGVDAKMVVYTKVSDSEFVDKVGSRGMRGFKFMLERMRILLGNGFNRADLFKVSIANIGMEVHKHPWVCEADVIAINWINQGLMSITGLRHLAATGKPLVWTMHDMWCMTGICHHAYECKRFREECGKCPFLLSGRMNDLSHSVWLKKRHLYADNRFTFVAVSNWLAGKAAESSLLGSQRVEVIPNAFPVESFLIRATHEIETFNLDYSRDLIVMGAARLDDPIKGLDIAIDALNYIFDNYPDVATGSMAVFFGELRDRTKLDRLRFPYRHLGMVNDWHMLRQLYASSKVVLSTSLYETLPGTLIEGQASGCLPVTFGEGGQADIVTEHLKNGYIARYLDHEDIARGIMWGLKAIPPYERLHESVGERFSSTSVARRYIDLFESLLKGKN